MRGILVVFFIILGSSVFAQISQPSSVADNGGGTATGGSNNNVASIGQSVICMSSGGGNSNCAGFLGSIMGAATDIHEQPHGSGLPENFSVGRPAPNPFNANISFDIEIPNKGTMEMKVYDISGRVVYLTKREIYPGNYNLIFTSGALPTGTYLYSISFGRKVFSGKIVLIK